MISEINNALVKILTNAVLEIVDGKDKVGICSLDKPGNLSLGLYLYSIRNCPEVSKSSLAQKGRSAVLITPRFCSFHYILAAFGKSEDSFKIVEEHRLLSAGIEAFEAVPVLTPRELGFTPRFTDNLKLQYEDLNFTEISSVWDKSGARYKLSCGYKVMPVEVPYIAGKITQKVLDLNSSLQEK